MALEQNYDPQVIYEYITTRKGELAFDIGANGGWLAKQMAQNFDKVVAVEPCDESYYTLHEKWDVKNLIPVHKAISDHNGTVELDVTHLTRRMGELFTGRSLDHWGPKLEGRIIPCVTLDELAKEYGWPDFVKIDTEGHEALIVDGGHEVFRRHPRFVIEVHDRRWGYEIERYFHEIKLGFTNHRHVFYAPHTDEFLDHYWMMDSMG